MHVNAQFATQFQSPKQVTEFIGVKKCSVNTLSQRLGSFENLLNEANQIHNLQVDPESLQSLPVENLYHILRFVHLDSLPSFAITCQIVLRTFLLLKYSIRIPSWKSMNHPFLKSSSDTTFIHCDKREFLLQTAAHFRKYDFETGQWAQPIRLEWPMPERYWTTSYLDNELFTFGGFIHEDEHNSLVRINEKRMMLVRGAIEVGEFPSRRIYASSCVWNNKIVIFGGQSEAFDFGKKPLWFNDVHVFDPQTNKYVKIQTKGTPPKPRGAPTITCYKDKLIVFGGGMWERYTMDGLLGVEYFKDIFQLSTEDWTWEKLEPKGIAPCVRAGHAVCLINDSLIITGGYNVRPNNVDYDVMSDSFILDLTEMEWIQGAKLPVPIGNHSMAYVPDREMIVICGGITSWDPYTKNKRVLYASLSEIVR